MTTIACDGYHMVGDKQCTDNHGQKVRKVWRIAGRYVMGGAGDYQQILKSKEAIKKQGIAKLKHKGCELLVYDRKTDKLWHFNDGFPAVIQHPYAIGTGEGYAMGAMRAGMTASEAVLIAHKSDVNTGRAQTKEAL